jgi:hypothetical protein
MLAQSQVPASQCDSESDGEVSVAESLTLFRVRFMKASIACGHELYILRLCRDLEHELVLLQTFAKDHQEIHIHLQDLSKKIQDLLLRPEFGKLKVEYSQYSQVEIFPSTLSRMSMFLQMLTDGFSLLDLPHKTRSRT